MGQRPSIVVTVADAARQAEPTLAVRKNSLYVAAVERHRATAIVIDASATDATRDAAFDAMDGLLLSGGADIDPARYGQPPGGAVATEPERDQLEARAWSAARGRAVPILGLCRGMQAINVFAGGTLLQHVEGHAGSPYGHGAPATHPLRLVPGSRLVGWMGGPTELEVNSYHHQGIRLTDLAADLVPSAWAASQAGDLVEGLEASDGGFVVGVQCHPERTESTPLAFERLFAAFVEAALAVSRQPAR